jgi:hypothetical protein
VRKKKAVVAVVTSVMGILRLRRLRYRGCVVLIYLREGFLVLCAVTGNFDI